MDYKLTKEDQEKIWQKAAVSLFVISEYVVEHNDRYPDKYFSAYAKKKKYVCNCKKGLYEMQDVPLCKYCGNLIEGYSYVDTPQAYDEAIETYKELSRDIENSELNICGRPGAGKRLYYVKSHPEKEDGLLIYYLSASPICDNDLNIKVEFEDIYVIDIAPGQKSAGYKVNKTKLTEMDPLKAMNINTQTMKGYTPVYYEDQENLLAFLLSNKLMATRTGILDAFNNSNTYMTTSRDGFLLTYFALYAKFPVIELLIKMGFNDLIQDLLKKISASYNKEDVHLRIKEFYKLLNPDTTKGSLALTIPRYISDFMRNKKANLKLYIEMSDIYQLDPSLSKENFEKICENDAFRVITSFNNSDSVSAFQILPSLLTYNYSLKEVLSYVAKQVQNKYKPSEYQHVFQYLTDYNRMCDLLSIKPDKFPKDLKKVHDETAKAYNYHFNATREANIAKVANRYKNLVKAINEKQEDYVVSLPENSVDVIQEGQAMHNCVGSYISRIANGETVIFFIRKKKSPEESFVTAEYRNDHLTQLYYRNNRPVENQDIRKLATEFCDRANRK